METRAIPLEGIRNARELGGLPLAGGRQVRPGCLIRCGRLSRMTPADRKALEETWQVGTIVDLRNSAEIAEHPDPPLAGARFKQISIFPDEATGVSKEDRGETDMISKGIQVARHYQSIGGSAKLMEQIYPSMVLSPVCVAGLKGFFDTLLEPEAGTVLWHCTAGKDRTGVTGALLLTALGASWDTVLEDYLLTNHQTKDYREALCGGMRQRGAGEDLVEEMNVLESVEPVYLESCWAAIRSRYGSVERFMTDRLGLDKAARERLLAQYTC